MVSGEVSVGGEPVLVMMVLPVPAEEVIVTLLHLPSTTLDALFAAIEPEAKTRRWR